MGRGTAPVLPQESYLVYVFNEISVLNGKPCVDLEDTSGSRRVFGLQSTPAAPPKSASAICSWK